MKVRFAGQQVDGFLIERVRPPTTPGRLTPLRRVVSDEPVLAPEIALATSGIAERYAGTRSDVLRLAVPPARRGGEQPSPAAPPVEAEPRRRRSGHHEHADAFLAHLAAAESPRGCAALLRGADWPAMVAQAALAT